MSDKQWVQHISGQGEKWEVDSSRTYADDTDYCVRAKLQNTRSKLHWLPKSEYRLCDPPERLKDVTAECTVLIADNGIQTIVHEGEVRFVTAWKGGGYLLRKVPLFESASQGIGGTRCAFIVEQKVS